MSVGLPCGNHLTGWQLLALIGVDASLQTHLAANRGLYARIHPHERVPCVQCPCPSLATTIMTRWQNVGFKACLFIIELMLCLQACACAVRTSIEPSSRDKCGSC